MKRIKTIIIEDEPLPQRRLKAMVEKNEDLNLVGVFDDPTEANEIISSGQVQLIFSDIQMPEMDGISFVTSLEGSPFVIFVTGHSEYADKGFELDVLDYIMKPLLTEERFAKSVQKVKRAISYQKNTARREYIKVKDGHKTIFIKPKEVLYLKAYGDYVIVQTSESSHLILGTLKAMEEMLPSENFVRIQRSYIVNIDEVNTVDATKVILKSNKEDIPIGLQYREAFFKLMGIH